MQDISGLEMIRTMETFEILDSLWDQEVIAVTKDGRYHQGKIVCLGCYSESWDTFTSKYVPSMAIEDSNGIRTYLIIRADPGVAYTGDISKVGYEIRPRPTDYP